jgi:hypothetical protein
VKAELKMTSTDSYPQIITPAKRQKSHEAMTGCERTKCLSKKWSDCYEADELRNFEERNDSVPLVYREDARPDTAKSRDSDFYGFYDDLLKDHG